MAIDTLQVQDVNFSRNPSTYVDAMVLAANTAETVTIPTNPATGLKATRVLISSQLTKDYYVNFHGATAAVPSADITDGTSVEVNPTNVYVKGMASFSVIAPQATILTFAWYD